MKISGNLISFLFAQFSSNFTKMVTIENYNPGLSDRERMISVGYIMNALEHSKVPLPFFDTPCIREFFKPVTKYSVKITDHHSLQPGM